MPTQTDFQRGYRQGAEAAADQADQYNGSTTHPGRLGDCILGKLNLRNAKVRRNKHAIRSYDDGVTQGMALALAEMQRACGQDSAVVEVANAAGLTLEECKKVGVDPYDLKALKKAGVPRSASTLRASGSSK